MVTLMLETDPIQGVRPDPRRRERCRDCYFWQKTDDTQGSCHRNPPAYDGQKRPITEDDAWCGEFKETTHA